VRFSLATLFCLLLYVGIIAAVAGALVRARQIAIDTYGSAEAQAEWDEWRDEARQMAEGTGPVQRRVPKSAEPPALVLMRDHFAACLVGSVLLTTVLFATFMFFVRGALAARP
jgi:hypothetical protein